MGSAMKFLCFCDVVDMLKLLFFLVKFQKMQHDVWKRQAHGVWLMGVV